MSVSAARFITILPVRSEPVNWRKSASSISAPPVSAVPLTIRITSGAPISRQPRSISIAISGVTSEGLITTAAPAISAGIASSKARMSGKFQGLITPTTGYGW